MVASSGPNFLEQIFGPTPVMHAAGGLARSSTGAIKSYFSSRVHKAGMKGITQDVFGVGAGKWGKILGLGGLGFSMAYGYSEGGVSGALKHGAIDMGINYGIRAGLSAVGMTMGGLAIGGVAVAGAAAGGFAMLAAQQGVSPLQLAARPKVREYMRKRAKLEMASPINDTFGNVSTMRQRSIMAMRESKITARSALGMEANRRYIPYLR